MLVSNSSQDYTLIKVICWSTNLSIAFKILGIHFALAAEMLKQICRFFSTVPSLSIKEAHSSGTASPFEKLAGVREGGGGGGGMGANMI